MLTLLKFEETSIQPVLIDRELHWIATEICKALKIANTSQAAENLDEDEKLLYPLHISGQSRQVLLVNESGLYHLIFQSRKEEAQRFRKWVTSEVLPSIRKTGSYSAQPTPDTLTQFELDVQQHPEHLQEAMQLTRVRMRYLKLLQKAQGTETPIPTEQVKALASPRPQTPLAQKVLAYLQKQKEPTNRRTIIRYCARTPVSITQPVLDELVESRQVVKMKIPGRRVEWFYCYQGC